MEFNTVRRIAIPTLLAANLVLTASGVEQNQPQPREQMAGVIAPVLPQCEAGQGSRTSILNEGDKRELPLLGHNSYEEGAETENAKRRTIGAITFTASGAVVTAQELSPTHREALQTATSVPYIDCIMRDHVKGVSLMITEHGGDNGFHDPNPDNTAQYDKLHFIFSQSDDENARRTLTQGAVLSLATHEGTHALFDEWKVTSDPEGARLIKELDALYVAELRIVTERFRATQGQEVIKELQALQKKFASHDAPRASQAISSLISKFSEEQGLDSVAVYNPYGYDAKRNDFLGMILDSVEKKEGEQSLSNLGDETKEVEYEEAVKRLNEKYRNFLETQFSGSDESTILASYTKKIGHPYNNADELVASSIAADQCDPEAVVREINNLPAEQRAIVVQQRKVILELFKRYNPELLPHMQTPALVDKL